MAAAGGRGEETRIQQESTAGRLHTQKLKSIHSFMYLLSILQNTRIHQSRHISQRNTNIIQR